MAVATCFWMICPALATPVVFTVTNADSGNTPGSFLAAWLGAKATTGESVITFNSSLAGAVITPLIGASNGYIPHTDRDITVDASALPRRVTIADFPIQLGDSSSYDESRKLTFRNIRLTGESTVGAFGGSVRMFDCLISGVIGGSPPKIGYPVVLTGNAGNPFIQLTPVAAVGHFERCVFSDNVGTGSLGGALSVTIRGSLTVLDSRFVRNSSNNVGSVAVSGEVEMEIESCYFAEHDKPAVSIILGNVNRSIINSTFTGNRQAVVSNPPLRIAHCTIARNHSDALKPAIEIATTLTLSHTILAENSQTPGETHHLAVGALVSEGHNLSDADTPGLNGPGDRIRTDPRLAPAAFYGGPHQTMPPLVGSPAIDAGDPAISSPPATDARGLPRVADGNGDLIARIDIGATEATPAFTVGHAADEDDGAAPWSLREAIRLAPEFSRIVFDRSLTGQTISLRTSLGGLGIPLAIDRSLMIDATSLPRGIRIGGGNQTRLAEIAADAAVSIHGVTLRNGYADSDGGGLVVDGDLCLHASALYRNTSDQRGGAIHLNGGRLVAENVTFAENHAGTSGGVIADRTDIRSNLVMRFCTVYQNTAVGNGSAGFQLGNTRALFQYTAVAANTNDTVTKNLAALPATTLESLGYNLADNVDMGFTTPLDKLTTAHGLQAAADNGGWVITCAVNPAATVMKAEIPTPVPDSLTNLTTLDGRSYTRDAVAWIGAYQPGGDTVDTDGDNLPDWWERFYQFDWLITNDANSDPDGDGFTNLVEFQNGTHPRIADGTPSDFRIISVANNATPGSLDITFTSSPGQFYTIQYSLKLEAPWSDLTTLLAATTQTTIIATLPPALQNEPRAFFRIKRLP